MVTTPIQQIASIGGGLVKQILTIIAVVAVSGGLYFLTRFIQKNSKKQKSFNIEAIIIDLNGVIDFDMLAFVKDESSGLLEMIFQNRKSDSIPPLPKHLIKNGKVILINYAPGHYCVLDTSGTIEMFNNGVWEVVPFGLGMKKYLMSKQREVMNKAENKKKKFEIYAPWITLGIAVIGALVIAFGLFTLGGYLDNTFITKRMEECMQVFLLQQK